MCLKLKPDHPNMALPVFIQRVLVEIRFHTFGDKPVPKSIRNLMCVRYPGGSDPSCQAVGSMVGHVPFDKVQMCGRET